MNPIVSLENLLPTVKEAGKIGLEGQKDVTFTYKEDGSVLTKYDTRINTFLYESIRNFFPDSNIITEEAEVEFDPEKPYTFAVDPIDGTDAFSQGMPGWAVSVGLLDHSLKPVAGIIYAPRWGFPTGEGTLIFSEVDGAVYINGKKLDCIPEAEDVPELHQIMVSSRNHKDWNLKEFPGKLRNTGGAVLNIAAVIMYYRVIGAIVSPCHIWDLAAAHAVLKNMGLSLEYISGKEIDYRSMLNGENAEEYMIAGTEREIGKIKGYISSFIPS